MADEWVLTGYDSAGQPIYGIGGTPSAGGPGGMQPFYTQQEQLRGLAPGSLAQMANVESSGNPNARQGSYEGLFQMGPAEQRAYGISDPYNPYQSAAGGAAYAQYNLSRLPQEYGPYGGFDAYMAHQQGAGGYGQFLGVDRDTLMSQMSLARQRNADSQRLAGYNANTWTVGDFLGTFQDRYNTAGNGQPWPDYSYNQPYASGGYPMGFGGSSAADYGGGGGGFSDFGMQTPSTDYGYNNSTYNSINQMLPGIGGAAQWGTPQRTAELNFTVGGPSGNEGRIWVDQNNGSGYWTEAPSAASLNGFDSGGGGGGDMGYGWATQQGHHDYMNAAQQMYANTVAQGQASQANYAAADAAQSQLLTQSSLANNPSYQYSQPGFIPPANYYSSMNAPSSGNYTWL